MRISTFLAAVLLASSPSQPTSLIVIRYSSRNSTVCDHAMTTWCHRSLRSPPHVSFGTAQVWHWLHRQIRRRSVCTPVVRRISSVRVLPTVALWAGAQADRRPRSVPRPGGDHPVEWFPVSGMTQERTLVNQHEEGTRSTNRPEPSERSSPGSRSGMSGSAAQRARSITACAGAYQRRIAGPNARRGPWPGLSRRRAHRARPGPGLRVVRSSQRPCQKGPTKPAAAHLNQARGGS